MPQRWPLNTGFTVYLVNHTSAETLNTVKLSAIFYWINEMFLFPKTEYQLLAITGTSRTSILIHGFFFWRRETTYMRHLSKNNGEKSNSKYLMVGSPLHTPRCFTWQQLEKTHLKTSRTKLIWIIMKGNKKNRNCAASEKPKYPRFTNMGCDVINSFLF